MLHVFRVDIGETYTFETDLAFKDVKTLKSRIEYEHRIPVSKQILLINGGELLDDDAVQVCMKTQETCAGIEENPIYLLDKSHLEQARPQQIALTPSNIPVIDQKIVNEWTSMPATYETIVERAKIAQKFNRFAQQMVENCERFSREQQAQYQGWMAVIANIDDTLSSFLLNQNSFDRLYHTYLAERTAYLELFESLPQSIEILHRLKLPHQLVSLVDSANIISQKSTVSTSTSSSSFSVEPSTSTSTHCSPPSNENETAQPGEISVFEWITAQLANMKIDDIIKGCSHVIQECTDELLQAMNEEISDLSKKISNNELKRLQGIEGRFALIQNELNAARRLQAEQKDCADYLTGQRQKFSSNVGNQRDLVLIKDVSAIHAQNVLAIANRHQSLFDIEKRLRQSKQEIINELHRRFKTLMSLQRCLVDHDAKQSLYIHKLNRTRKTMTFLKQLNQTPSLYYSFLFECVRRKQYSTIFNQFTQTIHRESKNVFKDELLKREQFVKQYEPHFLFNLLPGLKLLPAFFIKEPLSPMDTNLPELSLTELEELFIDYPDIKEQNSAMTIVDPSVNLSTLLRFLQTFEEANLAKTATVPLSVLIPSTTTIVNSTITKQLPSPTSSSSRSTVVRSQSSSDEVESPNEQKLTDTLVQQEEAPEEKTAPRENESSPQTPTNTATAGGGEVDEEYVQCTLEAVYSSTEMTLSPPSARPSVSQQTDNQEIKEIIKEFYSLRQQIEQTKTVQYDLIVNYHQTILKVITSLQQANFEHQQQIEQLNNDLANLNQDYETLKMQFEISEQSKQELQLKLATLEKDYEQFRRQQDIETSQIVKALQSDFEFELERLRSEHQETLNEMQSKQPSTTTTTTIDIQTDLKELVDQQTSAILFANADQATETEHIQSRDQASQTSPQESPSNEELMRRSFSQNQQVQFNQAIQRAVQNATSTQKKQIGHLEEQLQDKRARITKLKECIKNLQNFYTLSSLSPPTGQNPLVTSAIDDEQQPPAQTAKEQEEDQSTNRQAFLRRSEPISMPSSFVVQSMLAAGNAVSSPKTEQPTAMIVNNLLMDSCFKNSPSESSAAVEIYTPFAASPPNQVPLPLLSQTPLASQTTVNAASHPPVQARLSVNASPEPTPIAFFSVNRADQVIIYFDQNYQHYMVYTCLPTLHFIHSDCYELFNIQQKQNSQQQQANLNGSMSDSSANELPSISPLINTSMVNSSLFGTNGINPSSTPLLGQVTDKEYCQAKKPNNRFNVPLGTKFYRVRVKPWKPSAAAN